jgi:uncharacterized membrane protein
MNDQANQAQQVPPPPASTPARSPDVEAGRAFAILSYALSFIGLPFFLVPLIMRNNEFSLYHAKQCLILWLAGLAVSIVGGILTILCIGLVILLAGGIFLLVLNIMGLINAINGEQKPLPVIGVYADQWFKGITKV